MTRPAKRCPRSTGLPGINDYSYDYLTMSMATTPAVKSGRVLEGFALPNNPDIVLRKK